MEFEEKPDNFLNPEPAGPAYNPDDPFAPLPPQGGDGDNNRSDRRRQLRRRLLWGAGVIAVALAVTVYIRYFNPYVVDARVTGYITNVERRGIVFKTFEGEMITEASLTDTTRVYSRDFSFSVDDPVLARELQDNQGTGRPLTLTFKKFYGVIPWRGASRNIVTAVDVK